MEPECRLSDIIVAIASCWGLNHPYLYKMLSLESSMNFLHVLHVLLDSLRPHKPALQMSAWCWSLPHLLSFPVWYFILGTVSFITPCPLMSAWWQGSQPSCLPSLTIIPYLPETESWCSTKALDRVNIKEATLAFLQWPWGLSLMFISNITFVCNALCPCSHPHYLSHSLLIQVPSLS